MRKFSLIIFFILFSQLFAEDPYTFHVGAYTFTAINDLSGRGVLSEIFTDGSSNNPIDPEIVKPDLQRFGYQFDDSGNFIAPINTLYGVFDDGSGYPISFIIDTGIGFNMSGGRSMLKKWLDTKGFVRSAVQYVILTHGHPDHSGGLLDLDGSLLFPNSTLVMGLSDWNLWLSSKPDWAEFCCPDVLDKLLPFVQAGLNKYPDSRRLLIDTEGETIFSGMTVVRAGGHTSVNGPLAVIFESEGQRLYVLGDMYFAPNHMEHRDYGCSHDHHRRQSIDTRSFFTDQFLDSDLLFGMHFAFPGLGWYDPEINKFMPATCEMKL